MTFKDPILAENDRRNAVLHAPYDPLLGIGSPIERFPLMIKGFMRVYLPMSMRSHPVIKEIMNHGSIEQTIIVRDGDVVDDDLVEEVLSMINEIRLDHDFEYWAATCIWIQDKETLEDKPFILRGAQRKLLKNYEEDRLNNRPIRAILDKARQWGGSTLTQMYMFWIQQRHKLNWHMAVCAHLDDAAKNIRGMYTHAAERYPEDIGKVTLRPYEKSSKNMICSERGSIIGVGSVESPDQFRSYNYPMIHMSEVALYGQTAKKNANKLIQSLRSTVPNVPYSMIVLESTAMGRGNMFHNEWVAATSGRSSYRPVFVAWFEIDMYWRELTEDPKEFYNRIITNEYYKFLWEIGASLESINWYITFKAAENYSDLQMFQEFPSTAEESFTVSGRRVFSPMYTKLAEASCCEPISKGQLFADGTKGEDAFKNIQFSEVTNGDLWIWCEPDKSVDIRNRYLVVVDIGGKSKGADYSVIRVFDRYWLMDGGVPEVVATWRGHMDQDMLAWVAAQIAFWYNNALLIVESNSLRSEISDTEGDHFLTILDEIADYYDNLYTRTHPEKIRDGAPIQYGFHTNIATKGMVINAMNAALREGGYTEHDIRVIDECNQYEYKTDGTMGAVEGSHDDLVMATAIGIWGCQKALSLPEENKEREVRRRKHKRTEASL